MPKVFHDLKFRFIQLIYIHIYSFNTTDVVIKLMYHNLSLIPFKLNSEISRIDIKKSPKEQTLDDLLK